jgi:prepilin-type processing-associated H-X9-DG protein
LAPLAATVNVAFCDGSTICPTGCVVITGAELTLIETVALPFEQFASVTTALSTIEVVTVTLRDDETEVMPLCVMPSDQRTVHGPVPVSVNGMFTDDVPQETSIVAGSVIVGRGAMATSEVLLALQVLEVTVTARCTAPDEPDV